MSPSSVMEHPAALSSLSLESRPTPSSVDTRQPLMSRYCMSSAGMVESVLRLCPVRVSVVQAGEVAQIAQFAYAAVRAFCPAASPALKYQSSPQMYSSVRPAISATYMSPLSMPLYSRAILSNISR